MQDKISLAGDLGSGKSTVAKILIERLGADSYSTGGTMRAMAERHGMDINAFNVYTETHPEIDHELDNGLRALSDVDKLMIIDSRMAWHFTRGTFKVYLSCDVETASARILSAKRTDERSDSLEESVRKAKARRESERKRYMTQYGQDILDLTNYSLVLDTTYATPDVVAEALIGAFEEWQRDKSYTALLISPERLYYADDVAEVPEVERRAAMLDRGEDIPEVTVFEDGGDFFVQDGVESVLAYALNMEAHVPARLVKRTDASDIKYVRMSNSL